jgi:hypothetical protein
VVKILFFYTAKLILNLKNQLFMDFNAMHKQRKFMLIAAAAGVLGMILPWVSFMGYSANGLHGEGWLIFFAFIGAGALAWLGDQKKPLEKNNWLGALGAAAVGLLILLIIIIRIKFHVGAMSIGFWITIAAIGALAYAVLMLKSPGKSLRDTLNEAKQEVKNKLDNDPNT